MTATIGALPDSLDGYEPKDDASHLRLGLQMEGMMKFLERVEFVQWDDEKAKGHSKSYSKQVGWQYNPEYKRRPNLSWLEKLAGPVEVDAEDHDGNVGLINVWGYDLQDFLCAWLDKEGHANLSICEVILVDERFADLRPHVGLANVFWSHIQGEGFIGATTQHGEKGIGRGTFFHMSNMDSKDHDGQLPPHEKRFPWTDYFCLRQLQHDFHADRVALLIQEIGALVTSLDRRMTYLKRSFCVLEMYAAVAGGCVYVCHQMQTPSKAVMTGILASERPEEGYAHEWWSGPVDAASATTRDVVDKEKIDGYIEEGIPGGHAALNKIVTDAIIHSCRKP